MAQRTRSDDAPEGEDETFDAEAETVTDAWVGAFLSCSWGYGQTQTNFSQIIEVSDSGKTVVARRVRGKVAERSKGSEGVQPSAEQFGDEFRLQVRVSRADHGPSFRGSYPYLTSGKMDEGKRLDTHTPFGNEEGNTVHQTPANMGH